MLKCGTVSVRCALPTPGECHGLSHGLRLHCRDPIAFEKIVEQMIGKSYDPEKALNVLALAAASTLSREMTQGHYSTELR